MKDKWIKVTVQLPINGVEVLAYQARGNFFYIAEYSHERNEWREVIDGILITKVTHWQPLISPE